MFIRRSSCSCCCWGCSLMLAGLFFACPVSHGMSVSARASFFISDSRYYFKAGDSLVQHLMWTELLSPGGLWHFPLSVFLQIKSNSSHCLCKSHPFAWWSRICRSMYMQKEVPQLGFCLWDCLRLWLKGDKNLTVLLHAVGPSAPLHVFNIAQQQQSICRLTQ